MDIRFRSLSPPRRRRLAVWAVVASLLAGSCGGGGEADLLQVRIGANLWVGYDLVSLAADMGWFEEEGIHVEVVDLASLSDTRAAFERGYIDGMATTLMEVVQSRSGGVLNPVVVLITDYSDGADVVVARRAITSISGLAGARIAVDPPLGIYILSRMLAQAGMTLDDVQMVWASQSDMTALVWSGQIDAAVTFPPVSTELTTQMGYNTLFSSADIPGEVMDVVSFNEQFLRDHPEAVRAFVRVWGRALRYLSEEPDQAIAVIAAREGLDSAEAGDALAGVSLLTLDQQAELFQSGVPAETCSRAAEALLQIAVTTETISAAGCASSEFILDALGARP